MVLLSGGMLCSNWIKYSQVRLGKLLIWLQKEKLIEWAQISQLMSLPVLFFTRARGNKLERSPLKPHIISIPRQLAVIGAGKKFNTRRLFCSHVKKQITIKVTKVQIKS